MFIYKLDPQCDTQVASSNIQSDKLNGYVENVKPH